MSQVLNNIHICLYTFVIISNICYLYFYYDVPWFCLWVLRLSTEHVVAQPLHLYLFPPGLIVLLAIEELLPCIVLCDLIGCCSYTVEVRFTSVELCNSFLSVNVILNTKVSGITSHSSRSVRPREPTIL